MGQSVPSRIRVRRTWAAVLAALVAAGCGPTFDFEGQWMGNRDLPVRAGEDPSVIRTLGMVHLTVKPSGRFELIEAGVPYAGSVAYRDGKAFLRIDHYFGKPLNSQPEFAKLGATETELVPQPDGSVHFIDPAGFDDSPVVLKREPQPTK